MDFKNVQRRVYDALNVLSALEVINKDRNKISFKGFENLIATTIANEAKLGIPRDTPAAPGKDPETISKSATHDFLERISYNDVFYLNSYPFPLDEGRT